MQGLNIKVLILLLAVVLQVLGRDILASPPPLPPDCPTGLPFTDVDILNFALNLECLEAEFYSWAAFGHGLSPALLGHPGPGSVGGKKAALSPAVQAYANEIAIDEINHVKFLRTALGSKAVACPKLDIGPAFAAAADLAFGKKLSPPFSPYLNDLFFVIGAFVFEDVGVTAYNGAAPYVQSKKYLAAAASIEAVEAYHAGIIRLLVSQSAKKVTPYGVTVGQVSNAISDLRDKLDGDGDKDQGVVGPWGKPNLVPTDANSLAFARLPSEVIPIVKPFFPKGLNGYFK